MSRAHAPVAGRRACRWSSPIAGPLRMARPRSAVTVWPSAPALARLTGFSRSGRSNSLSWLALACETLVRPWPSLSLTAEGGQPVDDRCTVMPALVGQHQVHRPPGLSQGARRPLHVQRLDGAPDSVSGQDHLLPLREEWRSSAFRALVGRPVGPLPVLRSCMGNAGLPNTSATDERASRRGAQ
jgi:hypothetical protein